MIRRPPRSTLSSSSAASDVYKRQVVGGSVVPRATVVGAFAGLGSRLECLLRVEPGPGDAGLGGDGLEGDRFAGLVEAPQRAHRAGAGLFGSLPGGGGQMS